MNSQRFTSILFGLAVVLGLLSALDVVTPELGDTSNLTTAEAARSGSWTCSSPGLALGDTVTLVSSAASTGAAAAVVSTEAAPQPAPTASDAPVGGAGIAAEVTYDRFISGGEARVSRAAPFPEQAVENLVDHPPVPVARTELGVEARWRRQPAVIGRVWQRSAEFGPAGLLAAACIPGSSSTWTVPGLSTAGGAEATLVMSNPFASDASVTVTLATTTGPEQPALLENVVVPAQSVRLLPLNEHAPERRDLGIMVSTRSGRVVIEALQSVNAAIGGIEGLSIVPAAPTGATTWTVPWVAVTPPPPSGDSIEGDLAGTGTSRGDDVAEPAPTDPLTTAGDTRIVRSEGLDGTPGSWIWVTNVDQDDAILLITVHGPNGGELVELAGSSLLAPGAVRRIDLDGLTTQARTAVTVATENGVNIVAGVATQVVEEEDEARTGLTVQLGAPGPDTAWVLPGEGVAGRHQVLSLVNPGGEVAVVTVSAWGTAGIVRPASAQAIEVPPGTSMLVDLGAVLDPALGSSVVHVRAQSGEVVAGRVGFAAEGRLDLLASLGVPSRVWRGGTLVPTTRFDPSLTGEVSPSEPTPAQ